MNRIKSRTLATAALAALAAAAPAAAQVNAVGPDERTELAAGLRDFGSAAWNMELVHTQPKPEGFGDADGFFAELAETDVDAMTPEQQQQLRMRGFTELFSYANTDLAFRDDLVFVGNYHGFKIYELDADGVPQLLTSVVCPGGQGDVTVHGDLVFMSVEQNRGRLDCGTSGTETGGGDEEASADPERFRGIRIFDVSDLSAPVQVAAVQTCRGSHTHTLVPSPSDDNVLYVYNQGTAGVRASEELEICSAGDPDENPDTALFSIDVIEVPLDNPAAAAIVNRPRIFADARTGEIAGLWRGGPSGVASQRTGQTNHCHDITAFPELGIAAGACSGNGILLDITDPANPSRLDEIFDPDMAYWHSATFSNDGSKIVFTDEWGGGVGARCTSDSPDNWGANIITERTEDNELIGRSFYKLPGHQRETENCVAHNGNIVPVPGRDLFIQSWYQGGVSLMDFTDPENPMEIAYFDRGPISDAELFLGGYWSSYWHNGRIYGTAIIRGLDVLKLTPSEYLSEAEIAAAEQIAGGQHNPQTQYRVSWEDTPDVAMAYVDQLARGETVEAGIVERAREEIGRWADGEPRNRRMRRLASDLEGLIEGAEGRNAERLTELAALLNRAAG